jgi:hypothetical protein
MEDGDLFGNLFLHFPGFGGKQIASKQGLPGCQPQPC